MAVNPTIPASDLEASEAPPTSRSLLRNRDFMLLWSGQLVSTVGTTASNVVFPLLILALTNSPAAAGIAAALGSLPYLVLSLPVGALIDRWDRKRVMILCDVGRALTLASIPLAMLLGRLTIWQIYIASLVEGTLYVFFNIAETAALARVVATEQLPSAAAQNEVANSVAGILGPSLGATLYQAVSHGAPFIVDAVSYAGSVVSLFFIKTEFQSHAEVVDKNLRREIAEGLGWLWGRPLIRFLAMLMGGFNAVGAAETLIIIVLAKRLGAQDAQIGLIFSIASVGGIIGALVGGRIQQRFNFGPVMITTTWAVALLFPLYMVVPHFLLLGVVVGLVYFIIPINNVVQFSYRMALIPDALQGRVNSTFRLIAFGMRPLGAAVAGVLLEKAGAVPTVIVYSLWQVMLALVTTLNPHVRAAPRLEPLASE